MIPYKYNPKIWLRLVTGRDLKPWLHIRDISELPVAQLRDAGIEGLVFDVDNTLTHHHGREIHERIHEAFQQLQKDFKCCIYSNCQAARYEELKEMFDLPIVKYGLKKPLPDGFNHAAELLELPPGKIAMVGDRLLTDILGGNRAGFKTVLVDDFGGEEPGSIAFVRKLERSRLRKLKE